MNTHTRSGVMDRKHIRVFSFSLRLQQYTPAFCVFSCYLLNSPTEAFFSAGLCGSGSVVVLATPFHRYGTL